LRFALLPVALRVQQERRMTKLTDRQMAEVTGGGFKGVWVAVPGALAQAAANTWQRWGVKNGVPRIQFKIDDVKTKWFSLAK